MSEDASVVYTTRQAAEALGVGAAIMRRYAQTLEEITGQEIPQTRRDGRQFSREHLTTLLQAKALVDSHNGLSVKAALRMAASATGDAEGLPVSAPTGSITDSAALIAALQEAVTAPLAAELRELRAEQQALDERMIAINERIKTNLVAVLAAPPRRAACFALFRPLFRPSAMVQGLPPNDQLALERRPPTLLNWCQGRSNAAR